MILFSGSAHTSLARCLAAYLGLPLGKMQVMRFRDGESHIELQEDVTHKHALIVQSTSNPSNHHLLELCLMANTLKKNKTKKITAIIPYFAYGRQRSSAKLIVKLLKTAGINEIISIDLHQEYPASFFSIPIYDIPSTEIFAQDIQTKKFSDLVIISPDKGGILRAQNMAQKLNNAKLGIMDKHRLKKNKTKIISLNTNVKNKNCIIVDDIIDTGNTLSAAAFFLKEQGAKTISAYATHPVLSKNALSKIQISPIDELFVTNSIVVRSNKIYSKIKILQINSVLKPVIFKSLKYPE